MRPIPKKKFVERNEIRATRFWNFGPVPAYVPKPLVPVLDPDEYGRCLKRAGVENWSEIVQKHKDATLPKKPRVYKSTYQRQNVISPVCTHMEVLDSHVKLYVDGLFYVLYDKYFSKGVRPPFEEHARALRNLGYTEKAIERLRSKSKIDDLTKPQRLVLEEDDQPKKILKAVKKLF